MPNPCHGCTHLIARHRRGQPQQWCDRYQRTAEHRCIDYRTKPKAITTALRYHAGNTTKPRTPC